MLKRFKFIAFKRRLLLKRMEWELAFVSFSSIRNKQLFCVDNKQLLFIRKNSSNAFRAPFHQKWKQEVTNNG